MVGSLIGSSVIGSAVGAISSQNAANAQKKAALAAQKTIMDMFNTSRGELQPFVDAGSGALPMLEGLLGYGPKGAAGMQSTLESLPGYQFTLGQGLRSTQNSYAARGLGTSGAALKGAAGYATGLANSTYGTYADQLLRTAGIGAGSAASLAGAAGQAGGNIANAQIGYGNAQAGGAIGVGNAISGGLNGITNSLLMAAMLGSGGGFGGGSGAAATNGLMGSPYG